MPKLIENELFQENVIGLLETQLEVLREIRDYLTPVVSYGCTCVHLPANPEAPDHEVGCPHFSPEV